MSKRQPCFQGQAKSMCNSDSKSVREKHDRNNKNYNNKAPKTLTRVLLLARHLLAIQWLTILESCGADQIRSK